MNQINVSITNEDLKNAIAKIVKDEPNKEDFIRLLHDVLCEQHIACSHFFTLVLGGGLPKFPAIGTVGCLKLTDLPFGIQITDYQHLAKQGYIRVVIVDHRGYNAYCPLVVRLPSLDQDNKEGELANIAVKDFHDDCLIEF